jgi:hypothetical protein
MLKGSDMLIHTAMAKELYCQQAQHQYIVSMEALGYIVDCTISCASWTQLKIGVIVECCTVGTVVSLTDSSSTLMRQDSTLYSAGKQAGR